jgi:hypothetical protein
MKVIADLVVFDRMPEKHGTNDANYFCSHCQWLILPGEKHKKKEFAPGIWLMVHDECFERPEFKKRIERFKNEYRRGSEADSP